MRHHGLADGCISWRCVYSNSKCCMGRIHVKDNSTVVKIVGTHTHETEDYKIEAIDRYSNVKKEAQLTEKNPVSILIDNIGQISVNTTMCFPELDTVKRTIRRIRANKLGIIPKVKNVNDIVIPQGLVDNISKSILFYDSLSDGSEIRYLIMIHKEHVEVLNKTKVCYVDGSFYVASKPFYQIFTIHAKIGTLIIPVVYSLLPNKAGSTYSAVLSKIRQLAPLFEPCYIMMDFENALISAHTEIFPSAIIKGRYFHFSQSIIRKVHARHKGRYCDPKDGSLRNLIKSVQQLAFVEFTDLKNSFDAVKAELPGDVLQYLEETYFGKYNENKLILAPRYNLYFWNISDLKHQNLPITNNHVEAWHGHFNSFVGNYNPNLAILLNKIIKDMDLSTFKLVKSLVNK